MVRPKWKLLLAQRPATSDTAFVRTLMRASFRVHVRLADYAPSGEVLGHRGNVAKLNAVVYVTAAESRCLIEVVDGRCTISVVGESTAFKMIAAHHGACEASLAPQLLHQ